MGGGRLQRLDRFAVDADMGDEPLQAELRMGMGGSAPLRIDRLPARGIEIGVETWQDQGAAGVMRHDLQEIARREDGPGGAGSDDGGGQGGEALGFRRDHPVAPDGGLLQPLLGKMGRPGLAGDAEEIPGHPPERVQRGVDDGVELRPGHALGRHLVHEPHEVGGERQRIRRAGGNDERILGLEP